MAPDDDKSVHGKIELGKKPFVLQIGERVPYNILRRHYGTPSPQEYKDMQEVYKVQSPATIMVHWKSRNRIVPAEVELAIIDRKYLFVWYMSNPPYQDGRWMPLADVNDVTINPNGVTISEPPPSTQKGCLSLIPGLAPLIQKLFGNRGQDGPTPQ